MKLLVALTLLVAGAQVHAQPIFRCYGPDSEKLVRNEYSEWKISDDRHSVSSDQGERVLLNHTVESADTVPNFGGSVFDTGLAFRGWKNLGEKFVTLSISRDGLMMQIKEDLLREEKGFFGTKKTWIPDSHPEVCYRREIVDYMNPRLRMGSYLDINGVVYKSKDDYNRDGLMIDSAGRELHLTGAVLDSSVVRVFWANGTEVHLRQRP